jgi:hypothetical protein
MVALKRHLEIKGKKLLLLGPGYDTIGAILGVSRAPSLGFLKTK